MNQQEKQALKLELKHFMGSDTVYKNPLFGRFVYTEGVKHLAEAAECYWLIDYIFSHQLHPAIKQEDFQVWKLIVDDNKATILVEDGNDNVVTTLAIDYTDFPLESFTLWLVNQTLMLPSEY